MRTPLLKYGVNIKPITGKRREEILESTDSTAFNFEITQKLLEGTQVAFPNATCRNNVSNPLTAKLLDASIAMLKQAGVKTFNDKYMALVDPCHREEIMRYNDGTEIETNKNLEFQDVENYCTYSPNGKVYFVVIFGQGAFAIGEPAVYSRRRLGDFGVVTNSWITKPIMILNDNNFVRIESLAIDDVQRYKEKEARVPKSIEGLKRIKKKGWFFGFHI